MAAPAASHAEALSWPQAVAAIDAMPGVPTWQEIEAEVDDEVASRVDADLAPVQSDGWRASLRVRDLTGAISDWWRQELKRSFPSVYSYLLSHKRAYRQLTTDSTRVWFLGRFDSDDERDRRNYARRAVAHEDNYDCEAYALHRLTIEDAIQMLRTQAAYDATVATLGGYTDSEQRVASVRFKAGLEAYIMRTRTQLAQSGVIDLLALRQGTPVAQHIARYLAPETITAARPLLIRQHASQLQQLRALRAAMDVADQPAASVLASATRKLEQLVADVHQGEAKKQRTE